MRGVGVSAVMVEISPYLVDQRVLRRLSRGGSGGGAQGPARRAARPRRPVVSLLELWQERVAVPVLAGAVLFSVVAEDRLDPHAVRSKDEEVQLFRRRAAVQRNGARRTEAGEA